MKTIGDEIFLEPEEGTTVLPRVPASDPHYIKHVYCEGSRQHVHSYDSMGIHCSEPMCIHNKPEATNDN